MTIRGSKGAGANSTTTETTGSSNSKSGSVSVHIRGQKLSIKSDRDPRHVNELAAYVDQKVGVLQDAAPSVSLDKLLMLASMNVAEELFEARRKNEELRKALQKKVDAAIAIVDEFEADLE